MCARDELVGVVALQLHAEHARKSVRFAAKRDGSHPPPFFLCRE